MLSSTHTGGSGDPLALHWSEQHGEGARQAPWTRHPCVVPASDSLWVPHRCSLDLVTCRFTHRAPVSPGLPGANQSIENAEPPWKWGVRALPGPRREVPWLCGLS